MHHAELVVRLSPLSAAPASAAQVDAMAGPADPAASTGTRSDRHQATLARWRAQEWYRSRATAIGLVDACAVIDPAITARERAWVNGRVRATDGVSHMRLWRRGPLTYALTTDATRTVECDGVVAYIGPGRGLLVRLEIAIPFATCDLPL